MNHPLPGGAGLPFDIDYSRYAAGIVAAVREPVLVLSDDLRPTSASPAFYRTLEVSSLNHLDRMRNAVARIDTTGPHSAASI